MWEEVVRWSATFSVSSTLTRMLGSQLFITEKHPVRIAVHIYLIFAYAALCVMWTPLLIDVLHQITLLDNFSSLLFAPKIVPTSVFETEAGFYVAFMLQEHITGRTNPRYLLYQAHHIVSFVGIILLARSAPVLGLITLTTTDAADVVLHIRALLKAFGRHRFPTALRVSTWAAFVVFVLLRVCVSSILLYFLLVNAVEHPLLALIGLFIQYLSVKWAIEIYQSLSSNSDDGI